MKRLWTDNCQSKMEALGAAVFFPYVEVSYLFPAAVVLESGDECKCPTLEARALAPKSACDEVCTLPSHELPVTEVRQLLPPLNLGTPTIDEACSMTEEEWLRLIETELAIVPSCSLGSITVPTPATEVFAHMPRSTPSEEGSKDWISGTSSKLATEMNRQQGVLDPTLRIRNPRKLISRATMNATTMTRLGSAS
jgi:hypothetical protein